MIDAPSRHGPRSTNREVVVVPLVVCLLALSFWLLTFSVADPDLWGHLRFGQDILASKEIAKVDPYSFVTAGTEWINHEWLAEVLFAAAYASGGALGLGLLKALLWLGVAALVICELVRSHVPLIRGLVPLALMLVASHGSSYTIRPQAFTMLAIALTIWATQRHESGSRWALWTLPPVFLIWPNLHGGFVAGTALMLLWLVGHKIFDRHGASLFASVREGFGWDVAPVGLSLLATLATPYGPALWVFLLRTATVPRPEITEWAPVQIVSLLGLLYLTTLGLTGGAIIASRQQHSRATILLYACLALMPLVAVRHLPILAIGATIIAVPDFARAFERWIGASTPSRARIIPVVSLLFSVGFVGMSAYNLRAIPIEPATLAPPVRAVAMLAQTKSPARLAVEFNWGEYAIWHLGPRIQVSLDGRRETIYEESIYQESVAFQLGSRGWDTVLDVGGADVALVKRDMQAYNLLRLKPGWSLIYEDSLCGLFAADGSAVGAELRTVTPPDVPVDGQGSVFP